MAEHHQEAQKPRRKALKKSRLTTAEHFISAAKGLNLANQEQKDFYWKTFERKRTLHYIGATRRAAKLFEKEGKEVSRLFAAGKEKEALNFIEKNEKAWAEFLRATWQGIVEEIGKETYNNLKSAAGFEIKAEDAFNPWEATIQNYIRSTAASKVVKMHHSSKKAIRNIIDKQRADDATLDQIAKAINDKYKDFSRYRAFRIARTEIVGASNYASIKSAEQSEVVEYKEWASSGDKRVRESHEKVDGQKIPLKEKFKNGLLFPADYSANKPGETIQCRCTLVYFTKEAEKPKPAPKPAAPAKPKPKPAAKPKTPDKIRGHIMDLTYNDITARPRIFSKVADDLGVSIGKAERITKSVREWSGVHYTDIRRIQRKEVDPAVYTEAALYAKDIDEFIKKAPKWADTGTTYRGIGVDRDTANDILKKAQKKGGKLDMMGAASWSSARRVADNFANGGSVRIIFINKGPTNKGASIRHISKFDTEDEILVSKSAKYRAVEIRQLGPNDYEIDVEEI